MPKPLMDNPLKGSMLFATPTSMEELQEYVELFSGAEKVVAMTVMGMTWNLASYIIDMEMGLDNDEDT